MPFGYNLCWSKDMWDFFHGDNFHENCISVFFLWNNRQWDLFGGAEGTPDFFQSLCKWYYPHWVKRSSQEQNRIQSGRQPSNRLVLEAAWSQLMGFLGSETSLRDHIWVCNTSKFQLWDGQRVFTISAKLQWGLTHFSFTAVVPSAGNR